MTRRAKAIADMSDEDLVAAVAKRREALKAEKAALTTRIAVIDEHLAALGEAPFKPVFLNPRKTTPIEAPDDGRSSPAQIASNLPGPPAQEASSPGRLESARFDNDDLEIPAFMRRTGGEG